jgi:general secretion pathway protein I
MISRGRGTTRHRIIRLRGGFTLVEVLAAMMLIAIALPAIIKGISLATSVSTTARRRTEAVGLAESKLKEIVAAVEWQGGQMAGDFSPDWPDYHWQATVSNWPLDQTGLGIQEIDMQVTWPARGGQTDSCKLSTLTYLRGSTSTQ